MSESATRFFKEESDILTDDYDEDDYINEDYIGKFSASEIAALIGRHEYRTIAQGLYKNLQKDEKFKEALIEIKRETRNKKEIIVNKYLKEASSDIANIISHVTVNTDDIDGYVDSQITLAMSKMNIEDETSDDIITRVRKELKSRVNMSRGTKLEDISLEDLELKHGIKITERNAKLYKLECDFYNLSGRVDGIDVDGECVIEIKNRMKFMPRVPAYDLIQCVLYMKLTEYKKCMLVECFPDKTTRQTVLEWNDEEYEDIHESLCNLVRKIRKMTKNELRELIQQYDTDCAAS